LGGEKGLAARISCLIDRVSRETNKKEDKKYADRGKKRGEDDGETTC